MLLLSYLVVENSSYRKITSPRNFLSSPPHIMQREDVIDSFAFLFSCSVLFFICCSGVCACAHACSHTWRCVCGMRRSPEAIWKGTGGGSSTSTAARFPKRGTALFCCSHRGYLPTSHTVTQVYAHS